MARRREAEARRRYARRRRRMYRLIVRMLPMASILCIGLLLAAALVPEPEDGLDIPHVPAGNSGQEEYAPPQNPFIPPSLLEPDPEQDWELLLVNPWNPIPEDYSVSLAQLQNGLWVDERCYSALQRMLDACRAEGLSPVVCSAYRAREDQERLFQDKVQRLKAQGYAQQDAEAEAGKAIAYPGTSEHQTGLAVDIVDLSNQKLDKSQENTAVQKWLMVHSWEYGFILRYPNEKSEITGIIYEPWHYRYVGEAAAEEIYGQSICLEEYLEGSF